MNLEQIIPALALVAVLILVLPSFIETNIKKKIFLKNLIQVLKSFFKKQKVFGKTNKWT